MEKGRDHTDEDFKKWLLKKWETDMLLEEGVIKFISSPPTLQSIASVSLAISMWTQSEVIEEFHMIWICYCNDSDDYSYPKLETKMLKKIDESSLPDLLKYEISNFIHPIGMQLLKWFGVGEELQEYCSLMDLSELGGSIYWTMEGCIDKVKSLKELIVDKNPEKDFYRLYELACKYCLEEYIFDLWSKMPSEVKEKFDFIHEDYHTIPTDVFIIAYWTFIVRNEWDLMLEMNQIENNDCTILQNMIYWSISVGNLVSFKYFWQKLAEKEGEADNIEMWLELVTRKLFFISRSETSFDNAYLYIFFILLSHLNDKDKQREYFQNHSEPFLQILFRSLTHKKLFKQMLLILITQQCISEKAYISAMIDTVSEIEDEGTVEFFSDAWKVSPQYLKQAYLNGRLNGSCAIYVLLKLLKTKDLGKAHMVLKDMSLTEKELILSVIPTNKHLKSYILKYDFTLLDALFEEIASPDRNIQSIKYEMMRDFDNLGDVFRQWIYEGNISTLDTFLKWTFQTIHEIEIFKKEKIPIIPLYISLISRGNYDHLNQFLEWYFEKEEGIPKLEKIFFQEYNDHYLKNLLNELGSQKEHSSDSFEKFTKFILNSPEKNSNFKKICLDQIDNIVDSKHFEFATVVLNWCFDTTDEIDRYKTKMVLLKSGLKAQPPYDDFMLDKMIRNLTAWKRKDLMKWALPLSNEITAEVKHSLSRDENFKINSLVGLLWKRQWVKKKIIVQKRQTLFRLLDCKSVSEVDEIYAELEASETG